MEFSERVPPYSAAGASASAQVNLALGFTAFAYADLFEPHRLRDLLALFDDYLADRNRALATEFGQYRATLGEGLPPQTISDLLVRMAPYVGEFVAKLFGVASERDRQRAAIQEELDTIFVFRNEVLAQAQEKFKAEDLITWDLRQLQRQIEILKRIIAPGAHASDPE
ncbi:MAG: hypothetical protein ACREV1_18940, partial [Gammaproteobacteria bacterium]